MKTRCYCLYCPNHPLHSKQRDFKDILTGWWLGDFISSVYDEQGRLVNCLNPVSSAFSELNIDPDDYEFETTAYSDGVAVTGIEEEGFNIFANCKNETYEEV